ncbi:MAG: preprotein translocase subunit SecE [Clostridia bacterium]|nr:preprotein translocase subunit SecE [Clostridia bacterium]
MAEVTKKKPGFFKRIASFFKEYRSELKKVVWYPKNKVIRDTGIVVVALVICGLIIGVLDILFTQIILLLGQIG